MISPHKLVQALVLTALLIVGSIGAAVAQTDQGYWVGAVPKTVVGGTNPVTVVAVGGAAQTVAFAAYGNSAYDITLTANITFTFTAPPTVPTGNVQMMILHVRNIAGAWTMTWPAGLKWSNGTVPTFVTTAGTHYVITIYTDDAGATYVARLT